jgi:hypothetical protein
MRNPDVAYGQTTLPADIRSRFVINNNGITMHMLEAGFEGEGGHASCSCMVSPSWPTAGGK